MVVVGGGGGGKEEYVDIINVIIYFSMEIRLPKTGKNFILLIIFLIRSINVYITKLLNYNKNYK